MPLSPGAKVGLALLGIAAGASVAIGLARGAGPPGASIEISAAPTNLPDTGGPVTVSGATTGIPSGTPLTLLANGATVDQAVLQGTAFEFTYDVPPNAGPQPETVDLEVST